MLYNLLMLLLFYIVFIIYEETLYKLLAANNFYISIINSLFYYVAIAALLALINELLPKKIGKHFLRIVTFIISVWYGANIIVKRTFGITLSISATGMADQFMGGGFIKNTFIVLGKSWLVILLVVIPFILSILISIFYKKEELKLKKLFTYITIVIISALLFIASLFVFDIENYGLKDLYFNKRNNNQNVEYFGVLPSLLIDIRKEAMGFEEEIVIEEPVEEEKPNEELVKYEKQISDFDFKTLAENEENASIKQLHNFFANERVTYKNEYTGLFEGKNLIYIMAESFDGYAVSKELTPTLYKMIHDGFHFDNYYSVTNLSTIGGEFQELTGLIPDLTCLSWKWRESQGYGNYYPYALGNLFKERGYNTYAYHNHDYNFQDRNVYLKALGFDNYLGCGNGIENKGVACSYYGFPESDEEMINGTYEDYINDEQFMVYYATVSGHMGWEFTDNKMSIKHQAEVEHLEHSTTIKAFIAASLELEQAMADLLKALEDNGRLEDTVIVLAADHHPYGLTAEQMNELAGKELDQTFELYRNDLIIYNPTVENINIEKPCSTIDVLPTTLNLFGIPYDSRLIIGKDILVKGDGLVIFADGSWLTNKGRYNINNNTFTPNNNENVNDAYINSTNTLVTNRMLVSRNIMYYDYYRKLFNK